MDGRAVLAGDEPAVALGRASVGGMGVWVWCDVMLVRRPVESTMEGRTDSHRA